MIQLNRPITGKYLGFPCIIIAMDSENVYLVDADGKISKANFDVIEVDWKYDNEYGAWIDYGPIPEGSDDQEETDDGGEAVSGRIPDAEGAGRGDSGDQENGEAWSLDSREESGGEA